MKDAMNIMRDSMAAVTENKLPEMLEEINKLLFSHLKVMCIIILMISSFAMI